jgi:hypothetical protein
MAARFPGFPPSYESPSRHTGEGRYPGRIFWIPAENMPE